MSRWHVYIFIAKLGLLGEIQPTLVPQDAPESQDSTGTSDTLTLERWKDDEAPGAFPVWFGGLGVDSTNDLESCSECQQKPNLKFKDMQNDVERFI